MRKKKKIELVEAFASLCRDAGYKNAAVSDIDGEKFFDKVVDLLNHTLNLDEQDSVHERFFSVLSSDKKLNKLLDDPRFQEIFNDESKGISEIERYKDDDCIASFFVNNYFALDPKRFFAHGVGMTDTLAELEREKHKIFFDKNDGYYLNDKNATIYDREGNRLVEVVYVGGDRVYKFKHNNLPFALAPNTENGMIYAYELDYYNSCSDESELDINEAIACFTTDIPNEDTTLGYSYLIIATDKNEYISLFFLLCVAFITSFMLHIKSYRSGTLALNSMFLARLAMRR